MVKQPQRLGLQVINDMPSIVGVTLQLQLQLQWGYLVPPYTENRPGGITTVIECACATSATGWMTSCRLASVMGSKNYSSLYLIILHFEIFSDSILPLKHTKTKLAEPQTESHLVRTLCFTPGLCRRFRSSCRATGTSTCTRDDSNRGRISGVWGELSENKSPSSGQQREWASTITNQEQEVAVVENLSILAKIDWTTDKKNVMCIFQCWCAATLVK